MKNSHVVFDFVPPAQIQLVPKLFKLIFIFFCIYPSNKITAYTTHVDKPNITSNAKHHAREGGTFELTCEVKIAHDVKYKIEWVLPEGVHRDEVRPFISVPIDIHDLKMRESQRTTFLQQMVCVFNILYDVKEGKHLYFIFTKLLKSKSVNQTYPPGFASRGCKKKSKKPKMYCIFKITNYYI